MKICAIELENYGPFFGLHRFELSGRGLVAVLGDNADEPRMNSNGSGKSSLIDALDWGLFGVPPRGDAADAIINDEAAQAGQGTRVVVYAEDDEHALRIERTRKYDGHSGLRLFYDGEDGSSLDAKETQRYVEWHLGVDRQVFHATVLFAQSDLWKFADATDAERIDILTKILRLELVDVWLACGKEAVRDKNALIAQCDQRRAALSGQIDALTQIDDRALEAQYEQQRQQRIDATNTELRVCSEQLQDVQTRVGDLAALQAAIVAERPPERPAAQATIAYDAETGAQSLQAAQQFAAGRQGEVERLQRLSRLGPRCPTCEQPIDMYAKASVKEALQQTQDEHAEAKKTVASWQHYCKQVVAALDAGERAYQAQVAEHHRRMGALQGDLRARQGAQREAQHLHRRIEQLKMDLKTHQDAPNPAIAQRETRLGKIAGLQKSLDGVGEDLGNHRAEMGRISFWVEAFGPRGLKSYILDARLAEMTEAANYWVRLLTGDTYWIRLETQTALKTGALRNKFNIRVFCGRGGQVTERAYKSWSGGQKQRVSLAIDFGLSRLIGKRAQKSYDLLILDEIFKHLDAAGRDAVMEMLQALKQEKETILVVDHDADFQAQFEERVTVRMQDGRARIVQGETPDEPRPLPQPRAADDAPAGAKPVSTRTPVKAGSRAGKTGAAAGGTKRGRKRRGPGGGKPAGDDVGDRGA